MKKLKRLAAVVLAALCLFCLLPAAHAETTTTIMLYMCGSDLQDFALDNLYTMAGFDIPDNVNLVVWAGGAEQWDDDDLIEGGITSFHIEYESFVNLENQGFHSMGEAQTLYDFITTSVHDYPADRYGLILWDHGCGSTGGVCYDDNHYSDMLTMAEINDALYQHVMEDQAPKLDFIGCDACLMATYEMAVHLSGYADYFVASQELEPGYGWGYEKWLTEFCEDPEMSVEQLCQEIADGYYETCEENEDSTFYTQSVIDLNQVEPLRQAMESFSVSLSEALDNGQMASIARSRAKMYDFGSYYDDSLDMVDMQQFVKAVSDIAPDEADEVLESLERCVIYKKNGAAVEEAGGLSLLVPRFTLDSYEEYMQDYNACGYLDEYETFLNEYASLISTGDYVFSSTTPEMLGDEELGSESFLDFLFDLFFSDDDESWLDDEGEEVPELHDPELVMDPHNIFAYSMQLTDDEMSNLSYVEGMLLMDIGDGEGYIDLGYLRDAEIDWEHNKIYSMFDGTWPLLEGQPVAIYEQTGNQVSRRALIPAKVNDMECYLIVIFDKANPYGHVIGYSEGYTDDGLPLRGIEKFEKGDVVVPVYTLYDFENDVEDTFDGDPIVVKSEELAFEYFELKESDSNFIYCFCLNDIFGDYQLSDFIELNFEE